VAGSKLVRNVTHVGKKFPTLGKTSVDHGVHELSGVQNHALTLAKFVRG